MNVKVQIGDFSACHLYLVKGQFSAKAEININLENTESDKRDGV